MRSGTTLLRYLLDSHPNISCGPETVRFIPELRSFVERVMGSDTFRKTLPKFHLDEDDFYRLAVTDSLNAFFAPLCKASNKGRWATKTPSNVLHFDFLARTFPDACFIHVIRDGRDCVSSLENVAWWGNTLSNPVTFYNASRRWAEYVTAGRRHGASGLRYLEVRYESLTSNPKDELLRILDFIGEEWDDRLLQHDKRSYSHEVQVDPNNLSGATRPIQPQTSNWENKLSERQLRIFCRVAGSLLDELGYQIPAGLPRGDEFRKNTGKAPLSLRMEHWLLRLTGKLHGTTG